MSWLRNRMCEKSSQVAIGAAIIATGGIAAEPSSWTAAGAVDWLALIPVWAQSLVHVLLPDALPPTVPAAPAIPLPDPAAAAAPPETDPAAALARSLGVAQPGGSV